MQKQPTFPTPVAVFVPEEIEENETSTAEGCQVEGRRGKKASFIGDQKPSLCERLRTFLKNPVSEDNVTRSFSLKHQVHRWSGYFMDAKMEDRFLKSRLEGRRRGFMALSLVFIFIETLDWGLGAISSYQTDLDIARKCLTFIITLCFLFTGLFFWRSFHHLEKVMAGAIIFWVFCLSMLREEILFGSTSAETQAAVCGTDLFFNEAAIMTLTTAFTVSMIISVPLRRPLLVLTVGSVAVISIVTEFVEGSICGLAKQEVAVLTFFLLCEVVVLGAVMAAVLKEEYYLRILLTTIGHQRTRIANLVDERDDLLRSKGGTSSVERLVNLLAEVSRGLRKMENFFLVPESSGIERGTATQLSVSVRRMVKSLNEATILASNAEQLFDVDILGLLGRGKRGGVSRRRSADPGGESPADGVADTKMVSFLNANFAKTHTVALNHSHMVRDLSRRTSGRLESIPEENVGKQVSLMLLPVASKLPQSLAELPEEVEGQLSLSSEAEAHWGLDLRELLGVAVEGRLNGSDREDLEGGMGFVVKIKHPLPIVGVHLLRPLFQDPLQLTAIRKLTNFLTVAQANYCEDAPYHNALHGADVALMTVWLTQQVGVRCRLSPVQNLTVVIAALCHDLGHDGVNNLFHSNTESDLAQVYNDRSILENFHCAQTFRILKDPNCNFLSNLERSGWKAFRSGLIDLILDTDMKGHFQFMSSLKLRTKGDEFRQCLSRESWLNRMISEQSGKNMEQDVWLVTRGCLKAADLGHSAKPWEIHKKYSFAVTQEFFGQGDLEIAMQLPVSPLCSREGASPESLCKSQSGFLSFVCKELFVELSLIEQMARTGSGARDAGGGESSRCAPMHSPTSLCDEAESAGSCSRIAAVCVRHLNENVSRWNDTASTAALVPAYLFEEPQDKATLLASHPAVAPRGRDGGTATRTSMVSEELRTPLLSPGKEKGRTFFFDQETGERTGKPR